MSAIVVSDSTSALIISRPLMRALCAVRGIDMLLNAAAGSNLSAVHVMQSRAIVNSLFSAMVSFYECALIVRNDNGFIDLIVRFCFVLCAS
mmetsp:Transcript_26925/g.45823  ORF Transcript_26925/g.45823 Transcript_26925/m.45823 type:complete len:91 (-) Transcript_26925:3-275(-)